MKRNQISKNPSIGGAMIFPDVSHSGAMILTKIPDDYTVALSFDPRDAHLEGHTS